MDVHTSFHRVPVSIFTDNCHTERIMCIQEWCIPCFGRFKPELLNRLIGSRSPWQDYIFPTITTTSVWLWAMELGCAVLFRLSRDVMPWRHEYYRRTNNQCYVPWLYFKSYRRRSCIRSITHGHWFICHRGSQDGNINPRGRGGAPR